MNTLASIHSQVRYRKKQTPIPNCVFWLDANDNTTLTMSGSNVSAWADKIGNQSFAVQNTSYATKSTVANGTQILNFTAGGQYYNASLLPYTQSHTVFAVGYTTRTTYQYGYGYLISLITDLYWFFGVGPQGGVGGTTYNRFGSFYSNGTNWGTSNSALTPYSNNFAATSLCIMCNTNDNTSAGNIPYFNGSVGTARNGVTAAYTTPGIGIGYPASNAGSNQGWGGYIGEVLMYSRVLTTQERQSIEGYLAWKWGIQTSLPVSHPYYSVQPSVALK